MYDKTTLKTIKERKTLQIISVVDYYIFLIIYYYFRSLRKGFLYILHATNINAR